MLMHVRYIVGPPGTGKTTTIARDVEAASARYGADRVAICSLTKTAAQEAAGRVQLPAGRVGTLHSLAYHALGGKIVIAESHAKAWTARYPHWAMSRPVGDANDSPEERNAQELVGERLLACASVLRARRMPMAHAPAPVRQFHAAWEAWKQAEGYLDFTDLLTSALRETVMAPHAPAVLYVDEAQDLSQLEMDLVWHWGRHLEELVLVGDPAQALYDWRGSDADVVFPPTMPPEAVTVLAQSYRIPESVHTMALRWLRRHSGYRDFAYAPRPEHGQARRLPYRLLRPGEWLPDLEQILATCPSVMLMTTCSYMLRPLLGALRQTGLPFHNPWRGKQRAWNPLTAGTMPARLVALLRRDTEGYWSMADVRLWAEGLRAEGVFQRGGKTALTLHADDVPLGEVDAWCERVLLPEAWQLLRTLPPPRLLAWWREHLVSHVLDQADYPLAVYRRGGIEALTARPRLIVGTVHSLKGSEAACVLLAPDLSPAAFRVWTTGGRVARDAIIRQYYVGMTRAKDRLYILSPSQTRFVECA
jgi:superfamily I DNA/RNA helicase